MLKNVPVQKLRHGELTIEGYSRAAVQTYWRIAELKVGFDLGAHPWDFMGTPTWMISHVHLDHIAALPLYVARRRLMKMAPPRIFLPEYSIEHVRQMLRSFEKLDRGRLPCELIGVTDGQEFDLSRELVIRVLKTHHTVPSVGYVIFDRRHKLKAEYSDLSGEQIRDLKQAGQEVTEEKRIPLVGFTGDTSPRGLDDNPLFYETKILITELTFVAPDHRKQLIHKHGHMHLDDFVERQACFQNELVIAGHLSTRYSRQQAERMVRKKMPDMMGNRLYLWG
ncbi:MAG: MBL fold metallo-hydrolase [Mariniblastus sp.]|nr:MBL fold metallo-hydrolase [Mariniblastus sp.]